MRLPSGSTSAAIRCLDVVGAVVGLCLASPLLAGVALAVKLTSPGPALFRATRVGLRGRPFKLFKFRSMAVGAETQGAAITVAADPRVTPVGQVIRKWKLDELPQFLNILKGEMSLVGPRPESPRYVAQYSRDQLAVLEAKPGMTSPASLQYRDEASQLTGEDWESHYIHEVMPAKLAIDLDYIQKRTVWTDIGLIVGTVWALVTGKD